MKTLSFSLVALLTMLLASCDSDSAQKLPVEKPDQLLSEKQMMRLMVEIHLLEAHVTNKRLKNEESTKIFLRSEKKLFEEHGIDSAIYYANYNYYLSDVKVFKQLITTVTDSLAILKEQTLKEVEG